MDADVAAALRDGIAIPAHPLALTDAGDLDADAQRGLTRYYIASGAGGVAVGVHTTQFAIRERGLLQPVLELGAEAVRDAERPIVLVAGVCGDTRQAVAEAGFARDCGYDTVLLSFAALRDAPEDALLEHARVVGEVMPLFGFYLQPAVGGRVLSRAFWRRFAALPATVAIKIAPFDRYRTLDVVHAVAEVGRAGDVALYTGNDDHIVGDLLTEFRSVAGGSEVRQRIVGGLLGHWSVWTRPAITLFERARASAGEDVAGLLAVGAQVTDCNAALFDVANGFRGCIAGVQHVLFEQGRVASPRCLDPDEVLSPGQREAIERVQRAYPELTRP